MSFAWFTRVAIDLPCKAWRVVATVQYSCRRLDASMSALLQSNNVDPNNSKLGRLGTAIRAPSAELVVIGWLMTAVDASAFSP